MNRETTSKVHKGQQGANPKMRMLVYRERSYPARKVQGRDGSYTVAADSLVFIRVYSSQSLQFFIPG